MYILPIKASINKTWLVFDTFIRKKIQFAISENLLD